jgi:SAM-dependent methyltransferase
MAQTAPTASPERIMEMISGFERTAVIKAAVELDIFSAIGQGAVTAGQIAERREASQRGVRILCDYLVTTGLLTKSGDRYGLADDSAAFLDRASPMYMGSVVNFLASPYMKTFLDDLTESARKGGRAPDRVNSLTPENEMWVEFARSMMPMMFKPAQLVAAELPQDARKVLDIAAGHGLYGIMAGQRLQQARIVAVDWPNVLELAQENANRFGIGDRFAKLPGSAFEVDFGSDFDVVLLPNFLHHFDTPTNEGLLRKVHATLRPGGVAAIVEFVPNEDRVSPPWPAQFPVKMLAGTPAGDAYTMEELSGMLANVGFADIRRKDLEPTPSTLVLASRP